MTLEHWTFIRSFGLKLESGWITSRQEDESIQGFGQSADFVPLIEDRLCGGVSFGNLILGVVGDPEQLPALAAPQEFRLGNVRPLRRSGGVQSGAAHTRSCNAGRSQIEQEDAPELVAAPVDDVELVAPDLDAAFGRAKG